LIWWLRAHRLGAMAVTLAMFGFGVWGARAGWFLSGSVASPMRPGSVLPVAFTMPMAVVAVLCWGLAIDELPGPWTRSPRSNRHLAAAYALAVTFAGVVALGPAAALEPGGVAPVARNLVGLIGVALVVRRRVGGTGASVMVAAYLVTAALFGARPDGQGAWWAWTVVTGVHVADACIALGCFAAGIIATAHGTAERPGGTPRT
jgi:hypothetical protein